jgi:hypothetical protein
MVTNDSGGPAASVFTSTQKITAACSSETMKILQSPFRGRKICGLFPVPGPDTIFRYLKGENRPWYGAGVSPFSSPTIPTNDTKCAKILPVVNYMANRAKTKLPLTKLTSHQNNTPISGALMSNFGIEYGLSCMRSPVTPTICAKLTHETRPGVDVQYIPYVNKMSKARLVCAILDRYRHLNENCTITVPTKWPVMCSALQWQWPNAN